MDYVPVGGDGLGSPLQRMKGRVRLCPYYFCGERETKLGGVLATVCPADKKLLHGMRDAILAPVMAGA